jgi:enamine deaminase RidA (YjgF/YER057c/UK114 family)
MNDRSINPWTWQDQFSYSQAREVTGPHRVVYLAGQPSVDADGRPTAIGDMAGQLEQAFNNLETVLAAAGLGLADVVRLNYYTTDVDTLFQAWHVVTERLGQLDHAPTSTLLGVSRLAYPELLVELEATAVGS